MVDLPLKGVHRVRKRLADGTIRAYHYAWRGGPRIRGEFGSPEFVQHYAELTKRGPAPGTFASLIRAFEAAPEFTGLRARTKADYRLFLAKIEAAFGDMPIAALDDPAVRKEFLAWRDGMAASPKRADYSWTVLKRVLSWAKDRGIILFNHAERGGRLYRPDRSDKIWTEADVAAFMAVASAPLRLAMVLAIETGQRQGDLLALPWSAYDGAWISLRQSKSGRRIEVPVTAALRQALDGAKRVSPIILTSNANRPWSQKGFTDAWRAATRAAGLKDRTFHDLRGTAVTRLAEAGCSIPQICSVTGHALRDAGGIVDRYLARSRKLASAAIAKLERGGA